MDLAQLVIANLSGPMGYAVLFIASLGLSLSVFLPVPVFAITVAAAQILDPTLVGIIAGLGSAVGELSGYFIGRGGEKLLEKEGKEGKTYAKARELFRKYGFFGISLAAFFPLTPIDFVGIIAGGLNYGWKRFLLATIFGKIPRFLLVAYFSKELAGMVF